jgi:hypothetical protein
MLAIRPSPELSTNHAQPVHATPMTKTSALLKGVGALSLLLYTSAALAYIGPGLGTGAAAAILGIFAGLAMLVIGVIWYPLKKLIRYLRSTRK